MLKNSRREFFYLNSSFLTKKAARPHINKDEAA